MSNKEWDDVAGDMATDITELSFKINEVLANYVQGSNHKTMVVIPIMALSLGACIAKIGDASNKAMHTKNEREKLLKFINKFVMEFPAYENGSQGH